MTAPGDDTLRSRFAELRRDDDAAAPDFRAVLRRTESRNPLRRRRRVSYLWFAVAATVVCAAGIALQQVRHRQALRIAALAAPSISTWRSPTASLLRTSGGGVLASPGLLSSILDAATGAAVQH